MTEPIYAEDLPFWQTGKSSPDLWMERTRRVLVGLGGEVVAEAFAQDAMGRAVYMMAWKIGLDSYRVDWPVLATRKGNAVAARIQAATMLYHHIKAAGVSAAVMGPRAAFLAHLLLPDGRTAGGASGAHLAQYLPMMGNGPLLLGGGG